jgi:hypothetical protein
MSEPERSESGAPIYRHEAREGKFEPAFGEEQTIEAISSHLQRYVGRPEMVFHELISDLVHVDIHWVKPTPERNYHTLVTSGMSDRPMSAPEPGLRYAELMICLPTAWPLTHQSFRDERNYWPLRWLKLLAQLPHEYSTWLFASHTVPNGDPPQPFADNTKLCCALLFTPMLFDPGFHTLQADAEKTIHFLSLVPLYREEMDFKLRKGFEPLLERLGGEGVTELLNIERHNVCKKRWGLFRRQ